MVKIRLPKRKVPDLIQVIAIAGFSYGLFQINHVVGFIGTSISAFLYAESLNE